MNPWTLYASSGVAVFAVACYGLFTSAHVVRRTIAANVLGSGVFLVLVALAHRSSTAVDPVPHALVLTGIVVSVTSTACALAFARHLEQAKDGAEAGAEAGDDRDAAHPEPR